MVEMIYLPSAGINHNEEVRGKSLYYKIKLSSNKATPQKESKKILMGSIKDIELLAIYSASDITVVTVKFKGKTKVLSNADSINGFMLESAGNNYAVFSKSGKTYRVDLIKSKSNTKSSIKRASSEAFSKERGGSGPVGEIIDVGDHKIVDKSLLNHYAKNIDDIYKNIGIADMKKDGKLIGFRISFVKRGSPFSKLGLQRGDIIKSINGQEINSYNAAFNVYKNIGNIENLTLVIIRGKTEMELEYEIN